MYRTYGDDKSIERIADNAAIPRNPENTDYQRYLEWVADGNEPEVIEP